MEDNSYQLALNVKYITSITKEVVLNRVIDRNKVNIHRLTIVHDSTSYDFQCLDVKIIEEAYNRLVLAMEKGLNVISFKVVRDSQHTYLCYPVF